MNDTEAVTLAVATAPDTSCSLEWKCVSAVSTAATARALVKYRFEPSDRSDVDLLPRFRFEPVALATRASALASVKYRFEEPSVISSVLSFPATAVEIADVYAEVIAVSRVSVYAFAAVARTTSFASADAIASASA